ncbi:MAG: porin family protein [Rickettsiales bacterium]|jgi:hypothetical protein|nr:porin family protein [Rickettsiales bacterium]
MKKLSAFMLAAAISVPFASASAGVVDPYAGISVAGANAYFSGGLDNSPYTALGVQAGIKVPFVRGELEYNRMFHKDLSMGLGAVNLYLEPFPFIPVVSPYVGIGFGRVFDAKVDGVTLNSVGLFQSMLGLGVSIPKFPVRFDAELRGIFAGDMNPKTDTFDKTAVMGAFELRLKASYVF